MTYRQLTVALALLFLASGTVHAQQAAPTVTRMGNGLTVILLEDHAAPLVGVDVWVKAGSGNETPKNNGVSHFIEHLVFGATKKRDAGELDLEMESVGATLNARTSRDWAHFSTTVSSRYLPKALDVLADALSNAQFREQELQQERLVLLEEIAKLQTDPIEVCKHAIAAELYGSHPYGLPVEGTQENIRTISRQDIIDYYRTYYVPKNTAVVLVGDIDKQRALSEIGKAFQGYGSAALPELPTAELKPPDKQTNKLLTKPFKLTYLTIGFAGPVGNDFSDVCATDLMLAYMGYGYRSWMVDELQGKMKLATLVSADYLTQRQRGIITMFAAPTDGNLDKAKGAIFAKIASLRSEGIPEDGLATAKRSLLGDFAFQNETYGGRANSIGFYFAVSEPEFATNYINCIQSVTNADIMRVAQKYLDTSRCVVLVVGPDGGAR